MTYNATTTDSRETQKLASRVASRLRGGELIELVGDIGSGKTTFTQGLARALGYEGEVTSPTFTISRVYPIKGGLSLHHYDFYRLHGKDVVSQALHEALEDETAIVAIEWPGQGDAQLPAKRLRITLSPSEKEDERHIAVEALDSSLDYIVAGLKP